MVERNSCVVFAKSNNAVDDKLLVVYLYFHRFAPCFYASQEVVHANGIPLSSRDNEITLDRIRMIATFRFILWDALSMSFTHLSDTLHEQLPSKRCTLTL